MQDREKLVQKKNPSQKKKKKSIKPHLKQEE